MTTSPHRQHDSTPANKPSSVTPGCRTQLRRSQGRPSTRGVPKVQAAAADADAGARAAQVTAVQLADIADDAATRWSLKQEAADTAEESRIARDLVIALRRDLLGEYCDTISAAATEVMLRLGGEHLGFVLDNAFVPQVILPDGSTRATRQLSGGEKAQELRCALSSGSADSFPAVEPQG